MPSVQKLHASFIDTLLAQKASIQSLLGVRIMARTTTNIQQALAHDERRQLIVDHNSMTSKPDQGC